MGKIFCFCAWSDQRSANDRVGTKSSCHSIQRCYQCVGGNFKSIFFFGHSGHQWKYYSSVVDTGSHVRHIKRECSKCVFSKCLGCPECPYADDATKAGFQWIDEHDFAYDCQWKQSYSASQPDPGSGDSWDCLWPIVDGGFTALCSIGWCTTGSYCGEFCIGRFGCQYD